MSEAIWFVAGIAVLPAGAGVWWVVNTAVSKFRWCYTKPMDLTGKKLASRRSLIVGLTLELLDATHVRAIRLPFNRVFVIRSNPDREYDFVGKDWVLIGGDFENASGLIGKALDALGYAVEEDANA